VIILYLEHQVLLDKNVLQVFMGETVDIICNVKSLGKWKFKKGDLPNNTMVGYTTVGYSKNGSYYDIVNVESTGKHISK